MLKKPLVWKLLAFAVAAGGTLLFRINLCNMIYHCGCQSMEILGGKAGDLCNIHMPDMAHCPWCSHGWWGHNVPTGAILLSQVAVFFVPMNVSLRTRMILSVVAFFVVGAAVGLFFLAISHYPYFLGLHLG